MAKARRPRASDLTSHIGFWMRRVSNQVSHSFARKLESSGVTVAEWVVLREMHRTQETTSPGAIAEITGLSRGAISKLMSRLIDKNLVHRQEGRADRRYQEIRLTEKARNLVPKLARLADENDDLFFSPLSQAERQQLKETLMKLVEIHQLKTMPIE
ncbi:MAG: MarR family transcriptional regulator [Bdellovibrionaceae bacterium]|nr:MarR family transcriptional regulator [Pseudobdellovibrionaceae bacterium]MBX3033966.1 MarR family transcriptional regulator [Pseudobdellovibrionaceae bacterium]